MVGPLKKGNKGMKKFILGTRIKRLAACFLAAVVLTQAVAPTPSQAIIGLIARKKVVTIIGGATLAGGGVITAGSLIWASTATASNIGQAFAVAILAAYGIVGGAIIGGIGLIILDDPRAVTDLSFEALHLERDATRLGVTAAQIQAYNDEREELNAIRKQILAHAPDLGFTLEQARDEWNHYKRAVSQDAFLVASKVAESFFQSVRLEPVRQP
jgi:hypothetical protein